MIAPKLEPLCKPQKQRTHGRRENRSTAARAPVRHVSLPGHLLRQAPSRKSETIAQFLARVGWKFLVPSICVVNGEPVLRKRWHRVRIKQKDEVVFLSRPMGGRGGTAKSVAGIVALIALAAFAPWAAGPTGLFGFQVGTFGYFAATAAITMAGTLLINSLIMPRAGGQSGDPDPIYTVGTSGNLARLMQPIPVQYGLMKEQPDFAATPWSEFEGNDQYLNILLSNSCGKYHNHKIFLDDTELWDETTGYNTAFTGITHAFYDPGENIDLFPINVVQASEVSGQQVPVGPIVGQQGSFQAGGSPTGVWLGGFVANAAGTISKALAIDLVFPGGCFSQDTQGNIGNASAVIECEFRPVNAAGAPIGPYVQFFLRTFTYKTKNPTRVSVKLDVSPGRYEVRLSRRNAILDTKDGYNDVAWVGLRAFVDGPVSFTASSSLALRIKATNQISEGSARRISVLKTRILPVWNPDTQAFEEQPTRNPYWAGWDCVTNQVYGLKRQLSKVDFQTLFNYALDADARGDTFDYVFRSAIAGPEAIDTILKPVLTRHRWSGDVMTFVRDDWVETRQMLLTDREIIRGSIEVEWVMNTEDGADSVIVEYLDGEIYRPSEVQFPPDDPGGNPSFVSEKPARIRVEGITKRSKAYAMAARIYLQTVYRRRTVNLETEHDGRLLGFGSTVFVQTELPLSWGAGGEVLSLTGLTMEVRPAPAWEASVQHYVKIRDKIGRPFGPVKCSRGANDGVLLLDSADLALVETDQGRNISDAMDRAATAEPPSFSFGPADKREQPCIVMRGVPNRDRVTLTLAVDDIRVHETDLGAIPIAPPAQFPKDALAPVILSLNAIFRQGFIEPRLDVSWFHAPGALYYKAQISYDGGASWIGVYEGQDNNFSVVVDAAELQVRVQAVGVRTGAFSVITVEAPTVALPPNSVGPTQFIPALLYQVDTILSEGQDKIDELRSVFDGVLADVAARAKRDKKLLNKQSWDHRIDLINRIEIGDESLGASIEEVMTVATNTEASLAEYSLEVDAHLANNDSLIAINAQAVADLEGSLAAYQVVVNVRFLGVQAGVSLNALAIADLESAFSEFEVVVDARLDNVEAGVVLNATSFATLNLAFSNYQVTVSARFGTVESSVTSTQTALSDLNSAFAGFQNAANVTLGEHSASLLTYGEAIALLNGITAARWGVTTTVDGYVSGVELLNGGSGISQFTVLASIFRVVVPGVSGGASVPVFQISTVDGVTKIALRADMFADGSIYARSLVVEDLSSLSANLGVVTAGIVKSADNKMILDLDNVTFTMSD